MSLDALLPGQSARVVAIRGGRGVSLRLMQLGIVPGASVRVVGRGPFRGPILVEVNGSQVALGPGIARKVLVVPYA